MVCAAKAHTSGVTVLTTLLPIQTNKMGATKLLLPFISFNPHVIGEFVRLSSVHLQKTHDGHVNIVDGGIVGFVVLVVVILR